MRLGSPAIGGLWLQGFISQAQKWVQIEARAPLASCSVERRSFLVQDMPPPAPQAGDLTWTLGSAPPLPSLAGALGGSLISHLHRGCGARWLSEAQSHILGLLTPAWDSEGLASGPREFVRLCQGPWRVAFCPSRLSKLVLPGASWGPATLAPSAQCLVPTPPSLLITDACSCWSRVAPTRRDRPA